MISTRLVSIVFCCLALCPSSIFGQTELQKVDGITAQEILSHLVANTQKRSQMLQCYTAQREYHLLYTGVPGRREADMIVEVNYRAPDSKDFIIVSTSGSKLIINHVFKKLLETEKEAADAKSQSQTALNGENYNFELLGMEKIDGRPLYVLQLNPKTDNHLLYRGRIWVDARDYAVAKIDAEPAKRPSFWISHTRIHHEYRKVGNFWLPMRNESTIDVRLGGSAQLSIDYGKYRVTMASGVVDHAFDSCEASVAGETQTKIWPW